MIIIPDKKTNHNPLLSFTGVFEIIYELHKKQIT
ncbi:hypothetical protein SAMN05443144_105128 [Fodinibius roseus]|uniref:Uncharacterized protein n=1 Tax=Fodinibius roseus TaxID=1194090 RepID=A0A1M4YRK5_9BACT|nr:hypothetical protein SAMN05443144_105128 [Fodinibius roseus]